jgi:hypothetical protein
MASKLTRLTHKIAIKLHVVAESCTICSYRTRRPVRKLLDTHSYLKKTVITSITGMDNVGNIRRDEDNIKIDLRRVWTALISLG